MIWQKWVLLLALGLTENMNEAKKHTHALRGLAVHEMHWAFLPGIVVIWLRTTGRHQQFSTGEATIFKKVVEECPNSEKPGKHCPKLSFA